MRGGLRHRRAAALSAPAKAFAEFPLTYGVPGEPNQLFPILMEERGTTEELKRSDWGAWYEASKRAIARMNEIAFHEAIEAL